MSTNGSGSLARRVAFGCIVWLGLTSQAPAQQLELHPTRVAAPSLDGGGDWLNTATPLSLSDLRGKFVILDFWTYCCINCMHILPELKKLEHEYAQNLVVIGVHSAKFNTERDARNVREAIERYEIEHPVLNDPQQVLWRKFSVDMWPSLRVIDPEGQLVAFHRGEFSAEMIGRYLKQQIPNYRRRRVLDETPLNFKATIPQRFDLPLRYPGKVLGDAASGRLFVADTGHNRVVVAKLSGEVLDVIGSGVLGRDDGSFEQASFDHPQGLALRGETLFVADTENHLIRQVDLKTRRVSTIAGTGEQLRVQVVRGGLKPTGTKLASPWDLWLHDDDLFIAMAGTHQIWKYSLAAGTLGPFAGNAAEDIVDGPPLSRLPFQKGFASFAQPSGLASDGQVLFVADSEGSSIRAVAIQPGRPVTTVLGTARLPADRLFTFGDRDGPVAQAMLQHPLGVAYRDGRLYIADTYNSRIKELDLKQGLVRSIAGDGQPGRGMEPAQLDEPGGLCVVGDQLYVADTNNHVVRVLGLDGSSPLRALELKPLSPPARSNVGPTLPSTTTKPMTFAPVTIRPVERKLKAMIELTLPAEFKLNPDAPLRYFVQAAGTSLVEPAVLEQWTNVTSPSNKFELAIPLQTNADDNSNVSDQLKISLAFYYCRTGAEGICKAGEVTWSGRVTVAESGPIDRLELKYTVPK
jgi:thiol-disulfide isomerase/thioredoxin